MKEPYLEKLLRRLRLRRIFPYIEKKDVVLDVGCGWEAKALRALAPLIAKGYGMDLKVEKEDVPQNISLFDQRFEKQWPLQDSSCDKAIMLAVLEHIDPDQVPVVLTNIHRHLKSDGRLILTVPTPASQPLLEFLAYKLKIINEDEIRDHKVYYDNELLEKVLSENGFKIIKYKRFQLGMNSFCVAEKQPTDAIGDHEERT